MSAGPLPEAFARYLAASEIAAQLGPGHHCDTRRCREPVVVYGWYFRHAAGFPRPLGHERWLCAEHGTEFAARHHLELEPAPPEEVLRHDLPGGPEVRLSGMSRAQLTEQERRGWHCDFPGCRIPARYLSGLRFVTRARRVRSLSRFLCDRHARGFARRHGIDMDTVRAPGWVNR